MPKLTHEQFVQIVEAAADSRGKMKNLRVGESSVIVDILSKSGKSAYQYYFEFNKATGEYTYSGGFFAAKEPRFFAEAIQRAIKGITGA